MKRIALTAAALLLAGCSVGQSQWDSRAMDHTKVAFVGIPTVFGLGFTGTTTPVTRTLSLTNKHVAYPTLRHIIRTHPQCDLALIKQDNAGEILPDRIGISVPGQTVNLYGYSGRTLAPISSRGTIGGLERRGGCVVGWTDAGSVQGMSGGAVFSDYGSLVGIIYGADLVHGRTYFIAAVELKALLASQTSNAHE